MPREPFAPPRIADYNTVPFRTAEEVWFWFMDANTARMEGARARASEALVRRPCEVVDVLRILDQLYRHRRLVMDHLRVLRYYGLRKMPPDPWRKNEARAATLWREALEVLTPVLIQKKIMLPLPPAPAPTPAHAVRLPKKPSAARVFAASLFTPIYPATSPIS